MSKEERDHGWRASPHVSALVSAPLGLSRLLRLYPYCGESQVCLPCMSAQYELRSNGRERLVSGEASLTESSDSPMGPIRRGDPTD